jgi:hypothetical protein
MVLAEWTLAIRTISPEDAYKPNFRNLPYSEYYIMDKLQDPKGNGKFIPGVN